MLNSKLILGASSCSGLLFTITQLLPSLVPVLAQERYSNTNIGHSCSEYVNLNWKILYQSVNTKYVLQIAIIHTLCPGFARSWWYTAKFKGLQNHLKHSMKWHLLTAYHACLQTSLHWLHWYGEEAISLTDFEPVLPTSLSPVLLIATQNDIWSTLTCKTVTSPCNSTCPSCFSPVKNSRLVPWFSTN